MKFKDTVLKSYPTGSRYICNPPVMDTDKDTVFLVNGFYDFAQMLRDDGWEDCGIQYEGIGEFQAFRKGEDNYIVTEDPEFFKCYVKATEAAKALNLLNKDDRITLFQTVYLAGYGYDGFRTDFSTNGILADDDFPWQWGGVGAEVAERIDGIEVNPF